MPVKMDNWRFHLKARPFSVLTSKTISVSTKMKHIFMYALIFSLLSSVMVGVNAEKRYEISFGGKKGYVDDTGKIVIPPIFDSGSHFENNFAVVMIEQRFGVIDTQGKVVVPPKYGMMFPFSEGLAAALFVLEEEQDALWGYINKEGEVVIKPQFYDAFDFSYGCAVVRVTRSIGYTYINKEGNYLFQPIQASYLNRFNGKYGVLYNRDNTLSKIDLNGNMIDLPGFRMIGEFSEGMAPAIIIVDEKEETCYVDKDFNVLLKIESSDFPYPFSEGLAAVKRGDKWGYIDMSGNYVIEPRFDKVHSFRDGLALVKEGEKEFYIDARGNFHFNFLFPKDE